MYFDVQHYVLWQSGKSSYRAIPRYQTQADDRDPAPPANTPQVAAAVHNGRARSRLRRCLRQLVVPLHSRRLGHHALRQGLRERSLADLPLRESVEQLARLDTARLPGVLLLGLSSCYLHGGGGAA